MKPLRACLVALLLTPALASPQSTPLPDPRPDTGRTRLMWVSGLSGAWMAGVYAAHITPWWSGEKSGFRFKYDWYNNVWLEMDKLGHVYGNLHLTRATAAAYRFAGLSEERALWVGFGISTGFYTALELTDAGFADWGFSVPDYVANLVGAGFPLAQHYWPVLRRFNLKLSYRPSAFYRRPGAGRRAGFVDYQPYTYVTGDYDGMTYWLTFRMADLLPKRLDRLWPDWLQLAAGYGAHNLPQRNPAVKGRDFYLALDVDTGRLTGGHPMWRGMLAVLDAIHLPMPGVRFRRDAGPMVGFFF